MEKMIDIFLKEKPVRALIIIGKNDGEIYASQVTDEIDTTYSHTVKIISRLKEQELVESKKLGRKKVLRLTEKGQLCADLFEQLNDLDEEGGYDIMGQQTSISSKWGSTA